MLAERTVRRLSIRAPADALARHAGFLIEDALRTASLPGDGGEVLLLRRLRLPPFAAGASPQQVAQQLEALCRDLIAVDGELLDDAALAAAAVVRFNDALTAHMALTRLILAAASRQAWCWPMLVTGYRAALGSGAALRLVALSLADLPEAPAALPRWIGQLAAHGESACAALLLALAADDTTRLQRACAGAPKPARRVHAPRWRSLLDWSGACLGVDDVRHRWLLDMAAVCGADVDRQARPDPDAAAAPQALLEAAPAARAANAGIADNEQAAAELDAASSAPPLAGIGAPVTAPADGRPVVPETGHGEFTASASAAQEESSGAVSRAAPPALAACELSVTVTVATPPKPPSPQRQVTRAATDVPAGDASDDLPAVVDADVAQTSIDVPTAAGGLLFLVPLLVRLGLADLLCEDAARSDLPQRIFTILLLRLPIPDDDPAWLLCAPPLIVDEDAGREAGRWLARCRRHLRLHVGIGLHSLVCRPAAITITATHVDVRQAIDAVDLRVRRAGLDIDPGWVPWLGRVLRFHYGIDHS